jgi:hypothetical protein
METLLPMRGLALYHKITKHKEAGRAVQRASEVFLKRQLYLGERSGKVIHREFTYLHYPLYWHYDILGGLKTMLEAGFLNDGRCERAVELLRSKKLDSGWPAEKSYYRFSETDAPGADHVNWGGTSKRKANEWVTVDALTIEDRSG